MAPLLIRPIAVRTYMRRLHTQHHNGKRETGRAQRNGASQALGWPKAALIFDIETSVDAAQYPLFGCYRYDRWTTGSLQCVQEGFIYADELEEERPEQFRTLQEYVRTHAADVAPNGTPRLQLFSLRDFITKVFYPAAYDANALVVGFNLPFDLSRIAGDAGDGRGKYYGGFSLCLAEYLNHHLGTYAENKYRARVGLKHIDSKRSFMGFTANREAKRRHNTGRFLDLKTLAFALTNTGHSLTSACDAFSARHNKHEVDEHGVITPQYIDYNRQDVRASQALLERLREEFDPHPIHLDPCKAFSPASIAKAYLRAMGLRRPAMQFGNINPELLGNAMSAYFGGRAEVRVRNTSVPVLYCDFLSMYPTVNALMGLWDLLTAEHLDIVDVTTEFRALLEHMTLERCFDPTTWREFCVFAQVEAHGDVLPVRTEYAGRGQGWNIGINPLDADKPVWVTAPDLVATKLLTGKTPAVLRAFRIIPKGRQRTLVPISLGGHISIDPRHEDFFRVVIEERKRLHHRVELSKEDRARLGQFLKVLANAGGYGIYAEMNCQDIREDQSASVTIYGIDGRFESQTKSPEEPGEYCFPPVAALITGGARLMLALVEREVADRGGTYALCDTDSMAIIATEQGGIIPCVGGDRTTAAGHPGIYALSWAETRAIIARFERLNPYDRNIVPGSVLKIETENYSVEYPTREEQIYTYAISAKRYALFNMTDSGAIHIRKYSEHGLGHLLNPRDHTKSDTTWIEEAWQYLIAYALGKPAPEPAWLDRPAISRISVSSPTLWRAFARFNQGKPFRAQIKPMNFVLSAHIAPCGHPIGVDPQRCHLIAPYERHPHRWIDLPWINIYSGLQYQITTNMCGLSSLVRVKSYRDILEEYRTHPEPKSAAADGSACDRTTVGLLRRRPVRATSVIYMGKESNRLEDVEQWLVHSWDEVLGCYTDVETEWREVLHPYLMTLPRAQAARLLSLSERAVSALRNGHAQPSTHTRHFLRDAYARSQSA